MTDREAGKGDDRRKESAPGLHAAGYEAIDWSVGRTARPEYPRAQGAENQVRAGMVVTITGCPGFPDGQYRLYDAEMPE